MDRLINGRDSLITAAPGLQINKENVENSSASRLPRPFDKLMADHTKQNSSFSANASLNSPTMMSPLNRAWLGSPNSFICNIPESTILSGCVGFVDVWSRDGCDNRSLVFARILTRMGATVVKKFTKNEQVTHLVFKDGHKSFLQKAKNRQIKIVTCLWVERCRVTQTWVDEKDFIFDDTTYKPPKKFREMQPLDPEEEQIRSAERARRREQRKDRAVTFLSPLATGGTKASGDSLRKHALVSDTPFRSSPYKYFHPYLVAETPSDHIQRKLQRMREGKPIFSPPSSPASDSSQNDENDVDSQNSQNDESPIRNDESPTRRLNFNELRHDDDVTMNTIMSSQKSDMDLTCVQQNKIEIGCENANENTKNISSNNQSSHNSMISDESSSFRLHLSDSSMSFNDEHDSLKSDEKRDSMQVIVTSQSNKHTTNQNTAQPTDNAIPQNCAKKRVRRILCGDEVLKPASFLLSPQIENKNSRRPIRRSSIHASLAISNLFNTKSSSLDNIGNENTTPVATLPPAGVSAVKTATARGRFFPTPRSSTSSEEENDRRRRSREPSFSTAYDDNEVSTFPERRRDVVLKEISLNVQNYSFRKRNREASSTSSSSSNEKEKICRKPARKTAKRQFVENNKLNATREATKPRRSTDEFVNPMMQEARCKNNKKKKLRKKSVIVLTSLHSEERSLMEKIVHQLGRFRVHSCVKDEHASHVICGAARRTINVLRAISRGLWLLSKDWLIESKQAGYWLDEHNYEVDYFPSARLARLERSTALSWRSSLFSKVKGHVYVAPDTKPSTCELRELVTLCGGHVIGSPRRAVVRVGRLMTSQSLSAVKETWILDSISENILKPTEDYLIT